mgnify:FL=1
MIIPILMKKLTTDTSSEEVRRVTTLLDEHKIKYAIRTVRSRGSIGTALDSITYARANLAMYKGSNQPSFVYMVYVRHKDYEQAHDLVYGD